MQHNSVDVLETVPSTPDDASTGSNRQASALNLVPGLVQNDCCTTTNCSLVSTAAKLSSSNSFAHLSSPPSPISHLISFTFHLSSLISHLSSLISHL